MLEKHQPCEDSNYLEVFTPNEILDESIDSVQIDQATEEVRSDHPDEIDYLEGLPTERQALETMVERMETAVLAAAELATRNCVNCEVHNQCPLEGELKRREARGKEAERTLFERYHIAQARQEYVSYQYEDKQRNIPNAQAKQQSFIERIGRITDDDSKKDEYVQRVGKQLSKEQLRDFDSFLFGVVAESVSYDESERLADANGWAIRHATQEEDVHEGTDFFIGMPDSQQSEEVRVDAKSRSAYEKLVRSNDARVLLIGDGTYAAIVQRPRRDPVLVVRPEGTREHTAVYGTTNIDTQAGSKSVPSFVKDDRAAADFRDAVESGVKTISNLVAKKHLLVK